MHTVGVGLAVSQRLTSPTKRQSGAGNLAAHHTEGEVALTQLGAGFFVMSRRRRAERCGGVAGVDAPHGDPLLR